MQTVHIFHECEFVITNHYIIVYIVTLPVVNRILMVQVYTHVNSKM